MMVHAAVLGGVARRLSFAGYGPLQVALAIVELELPLFNEPDRSQTIDLKPAPAEMTIADQERLHDRCVGGRPLANQRQPYLGANTIGESFRVHRRNELKEGRAFAKGGTPIARVRPSVRQD